MAFVSEIVSGDELDPDDDRRRPPLPSPTNPEPPHAEPPESRNRLFGTSTRQTTRSILPTRGTSNPDEVESLSGVVEMPPPDREGCTRRRVEV